MRQFAPIINRVLSPLLFLAITDLIIASGSLYLASLVRFGMNIEDVEQYMGDAMPRALSFAFWIMVGMISVGMYRARQRPRRWEMVARTLVAVALGSFAYVLFFYFFPHMTTGRGALTLGVIFCAVGLTVSRIYLLRLVDVNPVRRRILVLGAGKAASWWKSRVVPR